MPKRAAILHGTSGDPSKDGWQKALKNELEASDYEVFFPQLPNSRRPDIAAYDRFLRASGWDFSDNIVFGHSSGSTALLHLLGQDWFPKIRCAVLVGTFLNEKKLTGVDWYEPGQFDALFVETFEPRNLKKKADSFYFVHGDDDPYCDYDEAREFCEKLGGTFITVPGGGHLSSSTRGTGLSEMTRVLKAEKVL